MDIRTRTTVAALSSLAAAAAGIAALSMPSSRAAANETSRPAANVLAAKDLYADRCSACHNLPDPVEKAMTRAEWQRTVNRMLTKYKASDTITPTEAAQIVSYLATFAPNPGSANAAVAGNPWATDTTDVWPTAPATTRVFNFESADPTAGLSLTSAGVNGPAPIWKAAKIGASPNGSALRVSQPTPSPDRFAVVLDQADTPRNVDVKVRFQIEAGKISPAVGIIFGYANPKEYYVLRYAQTSDDVTLIKVMEPTHTTLQKTAVNLGGPETTLASTVTPTPTVSTAAGPAWHTLRLLVKNGQIRAWIDMNKRINTQDATYSGGKVGLWTQGDTRAAFDDWTVDLYDRAGSASKFNF